MYGKLLQYQQPPPFISMMPAWNTTRLPVLFLLSTTTIFSFHSNSDPSWRLAMLRMSSAPKTHPPHTDAFFMRCVAIRHYPSMHIRGRIVTERTGTVEKRIRVGQALPAFSAASIHRQNNPFKASRRCANAAD